MKLNMLIVLFFGMLACSTPENKQAEQPEKEVTKKKEIVKTDFQTILDSTKLAGCILVYDVNEDTYYANDFEWAKQGFLPASTFKIPNSMIALETAVVESDSTLFKWNGEDRAMDIWEQDLVFKQAFQYSCVPCYQDVARQIGAKRMQHFIDTLNYGSIAVDVSNIHNFWLQGAATISPLQQIDFLKRFYYSKLPISNRTTNTLKRMMELEVTQDYIISGKTGWSIQNEIDNGWFVGYVEQKNNTYFFAANVEPKPDFDRSHFAKARKDVVFSALENMKIIGGEKY